LDGPTNTSHIGLISSEISRYTGQHWQGGPISTLRRKPTPQLLPVPCRACPTASGCPLARVPDRVADWPACTCARESATPTGLTPRCGCCCSTPELVSRPGVLRRPVAACGSCHQRQMTDIGAGPEGQSAADPDASTEWGDGTGLACLLLVYSFNALGRRNS
jgi:hypothetical protein